METYLLAILAGVILISAKLGEGIFQRIGLPGLLGAIMAGLVIGPAGLGIVSHDILRELSLLLSIGISFTLFLSGVEEFSNPAILRPNKREFLYSIMLLVLTIIPLYFVVSLVWKAGLEARLAYSTALAVVSLGPLIKIILESEAIDEKLLSVLRVSLIAELISIIVFNTAYRGLNLLDFTLSALFVTTVYFTGRRYLDRGLRLIEKYFFVKEAPFAVIIGMILAVSYLAELIGFNAAVTALLLGMFLSSYLSKRPAYLERIRAITHGFLEPLFFAGVGLYAARITSYMVLVAAIISLLVAPRLLIGKKLGLSPRESLVLAAKGGVDAAMLLTLLRTGMISQDAYVTGIMTLVASTTFAGLAFKITRPSVEFWRLPVGAMPLENNVVYYAEKASYAARLASIYGAVVVVDEEYKPIGYITAEDLVDLDPRLLEKIAAVIISRPEIPVVNSNTLVAEILQDQLMREPIIAIVDGEGSLIGTLTPKKLLQILLKPKQKG
ncbi:MAG: cation:proton antiporter [Pyrodictiaceae archaeon]